MAFFKAFIRVVKSINSEQSWSNMFGSENVISEKLIEASSKDEVKCFLADKYPQFFPEKKVFTKETKDKAQFFYVLIYELSNYELQQIVDGPWQCCQCGQKHESKYHSRPRYSNKLFADKLFCQSDDDICFNNFKIDYYKDIDLPDDEHFIKKDSPNYIYKITEKPTGKSYIGKTRNAPFFRWWNHLKHSSSPFGLYFKTTSLSNWNFEVLEILPAETKDADVFEIESKYILQFDCINNGFNTLISKKQLSKSNQCEVNFD